jgi:hypothetical protein
MVNRFAWACWWRPDAATPWRQLGHGAFYSEALAAGMTKQSAGEHLCLFGREMPPGAIWRECGERRFGR